MVVVAQLVRALDCGSRGRGFEPHLPPEKCSELKDSLFLCKKLGFNKLIFGYLSNQKIFKKMKKIFLLFIVFALNNTINAQDYKRGKIKVRKPYQQEFYLQIDTALIFTKGNLADYIQSKIVYTPEIKKAVTNCIVWISCIVDEIGDVTFVELKKGCDPILSKEALRVISQLKGFKPLIKDNKKYAVRFDVPVKFVNM